MPASFKHRLQILRNIRRLCDSAGFIVVQYLHLRRCSLHNIFIVLISRSYMYTSGRSLADMCFKNEYYKQ